MANADIRIELDMEGARADLDSFRARLSEVPEHVAEVVLSRFFRLLDANPLKVFEAPRGFASIASHRVVRLGIGGIGELCAAALAADDVSVGRTFHVEPSV